MPNSCICLQNFLSTLDRPLTVDDDKITRWHPKFLVDQLPAIEVAELPQPPEVNRIFTAKAALEEARNRLTPKVRKFSSESRSTSMSYNLNHRFNVLPETF